jgi:hypothetical protein
MRQLRWPGPVIRPRFKVEFEAGEIILTAPFSARKVPPIHNLAPDKVQERVQSSRFTDCSQEGRRHPKIKHAGHGCAAIAASSDHADHSYSYQCQEDIGSDGKMNAGQEVASDSHYSTKDRDADGERDPLACGY